MNKCAIVIVYNGDPADREVQRLTAQALCNAVSNIEGTSITTFGLDSDDIAKALVAYGIKNHKETKCVDVEDAIRKAVKYISDRFTDDIKKGTSRFTSNLSYGYIMAKIHGNDEPLVASVEVLSNCSATDIPSDVRFAYGFDFGQLLDIIKECHTTCAGRIVM